MQNTDSMMELLSGYEAYSSVEAINLSAASEAPATTIPCGAAGLFFGAVGVSAIVSEYGSQVYKAYQ